jgi:hypothetical protein
MNQDNSQPCGQIPASEPQKTPGYIKKKVKGQKRPNRGSRARKDWRGSLAKVIKKSIAVADLMTGEDTEEDYRILCEAKRATHRVFNLETKKMEEVPDWKTRLAAFALSRAYHEGKPVERQIQVTAKYEDLSDLLARVRASPEARRELGDLVPIDAPAK